MNLIVRTNGFCVFSANDVNREDVSKSRDGWNCDCNRVTSNIITIEYRQILAVIISVRSRVI